MCAAQHSGTCSSHQDTGEATRDERERAGGEMQAVSVMGGWVGERSGGPALPRIDNWSGCQCTSSREEG